MIQKVFSVPSSDDEKYILRNFSLKDVKPLFEIMSQTQNVIAYGRQILYSDVEKMIKWNLKDSKNDTLWAIGTIGKIIGFVGYTPIKKDKKLPLFSYILPEGVLDLNKKNFYLTIYLDKNYLGKGIGKMAVKESLTLLSERDKNYTLFSSAFSDNSPSIGLAKSLGMEMVSSGKVLGKDVSVYMMKK